MERHLEQDNVFHISGVAFCLTAYNTCIIIMRLPVLIHLTMVNIKPLWCHVITMECFKSFPRRFFQSVCVWGGRGGGVFNSILSASNKQLVTLKFDTSAICFLLAGETIFSLKFKAVSNTPSFLSIFFGSRGGQLTAKGALRLSQIGLLNKRSATTRRVLLIPWQNFGKTKCYQQQEESRNCCNNCLGTFFL